MSGLASRLLRMAKSVNGKPLCDWPLWSTGETLAVALVLNRYAVLDAMSYTMVEAMDRLAGDIDIPALRAIERELQA